MARVVQGLATNLGRLVITERSRKPMKKHRAVTVRLPLKQQKINSATIIAFRWEPTVSQRHSKNQLVATAALTWNLLSTY